MTDLDLATSYETLRNNVGAVWLRREVVRAKGPDVVSYLQGQVTQDVTAIEVGASAWSFVLQPHGKVDAFVRLTRCADDEFVIDVDRGYSDLLLERLNRFKLRTKVEFTALDWKVLGLRGPKVSGVDRPGNGIVADASWADLAGIDVLGEQPEVPTGVALCDDDAYEALRIELGIPQMGHELDERTIPTEAGMNDRTVSFSKGCYTGQELVARIDSRGGNVPRNLRGIVIEGDELPDLGAKIALVNDSRSTKQLAKPLGTVTSVTYSPGFGRPVALSLIRRDVIVPLDAAITWDGGSALCRIEKLPLAPELVP